MKKEELIQAVAKELKIPEHKVKPIVNTFLNVMMAALLNGDEVMVRGFGTLKVKHLNGGRKLKDLRTGEQYITKPSDKVVFIQSKKFGVKSLRPC